MDKMVVLPRSGKFRTGVFAREHFSGWLLVSKGSSGPLVGTPVEVGEERKKERKFVGQRSSERAELDGVGRERGELSERQT